MKIEIKNCWYYYLSLENDLARTAQFVEPHSQESVYSFEFYKILVLACVEVESLFKGFCAFLENENAVDISIYKGILLKHLPQIVDAEVLITRSGSSYKPFSGWNNSPLPWWETYNQVKHNRGEKLIEATYLNAVLALSALYLLVLYYAKMTGADLPDQQSEYIVSKYSKKYLVVSPEEQLPGFDK